MKRALLLGKLTVLAALVPSIAYGQSSPSVPRQHSESSSLQASVSPAAQPPTDPNTQIAPAKDWYGYQILVGDAATIGMFALAWNKGSRAWLDGSVGSFLIPSPIIHALYDSPGRAGGSFGLRLGAGIIGTYAFATEAGCFKDPSEYHGPPCSPAPLYAAIIVASLIDSAFLAWQAPSPSRTDLSPRPVSRSQSPFSLQVTPTVASMPGGGFLGLSGSF